MVAGGNLDQELQTERKDEIGELTQSFNYMVRKLREERVLEEKLRKAEHLASIGQFSTSIAHEIRNPLNFISLSIDHIKEKYTPYNGEGKETFDSLIINIKNEIQRVSRFAESFLEYGRPLEINTTPTDIRQLIEDVLELILAKAQKEHIIIERDFETMPELPGP
jgi:nitrogen fixation/metabolism regulation signal transduction histidine kinase